MASAAKPDLASAMFPALSREAKAKAAQQAKAREEQKVRNKRLTANFQMLRLYPISDFSGWFVG